ncbi:MAG: hypothetical protein ABI528_10050 [bacterium]
MTDTKLISLLKQFSLDEMKELEKFIASPYFCRTRDFNPLYKILKKYFPEFSDKELNNESVFTKLYPGKKYEGIKSDNILKTLFSDMHKVCKEFLIQLELAGDDKKREYYLLNQLRKKNINKEFEKDHKRILEKDEFRNKGSVDFFIENYFLDLVYRDYSLDNDDFRNAFESTISGGECTAAMALLTCLRFTDEKILAGGYNLEIRDNLVDNIMKHLDLEGLISEMKKKDDWYFPYIYTHYLVHKLHIEKDKKIYLELKKYLKDNYGLFGRDELYVLRSMLLTYCSLNVGGKDNREFLREIFELYKENLELGIYKRGEDEEFHVVLFRNMVINSGNIGETEWLLNFIKDYSGELPEEHRENMINFSTGYYYLKTCEYERSLEYFSRIRFSLFVFKYDLRTLQLIIFYELNHYEQAYSLIDSTMHFLNDSTQAAGPIAEGTRNFIKFYRELMKLRISGKENKTEFEFLRKQILDEKLLASRQWFMEKTEGLGIRN